MPQPRDGVEARSHRLVHHLCQTGTIFLNLTAVSPHLCMPNRIHSQSMFTLGASYCSNGIYLANYSERITDSILFLCMCSVTFLREPSCRRSNPRAEIVLQEGEFGDVVPSMVASKLVDLCNGCFATRPTRRPSSEEVCERMLECCEHLPFG